MLTRDQISRARDLRDAGKSWEYAAELIGVSYYVLRAALDPQWAEEKRARVRANHRRRKGLHVPRSTNGPQISHPSLNVASSVVVPRDVLFDRDRRASIIPTIHQAILGDPLPGRSALDKRKPHVVVDNGDAR